MKKRSLIFGLLVSFLIISEVKAQLFVGPKGGAQFNKLFFQEKDNLLDLNSEINLGFNAGLAAFLNVRDNFNLYSEISYAQKGKTITGISDPDLRHRTVYNFIEMPVLFRLTFDGKVKSTKDFTWYVNMGPNVGYWLSGSGSLYSQELEYEQSFGTLDYKLTFEQGSIPDDNFETVDIVGANRLQFGLLFGGGLILRPSQSQMFMFDARLEISGTNLGQHEHQITYPVSFFGYNDDLQSNIVGLRVSAAYLFELNIKEGKKGKSTIDKKGKRRK